MYLNFEFDDGVMIRDATARIEMESTSWELTFIDDSDVSDLELYMHQHYDRLDSAIADATLRLGPDTDSDFDEFK